LAILLGIRALELSAQTETQSFSGQYAVTELSTLGGTVGAADSINDKGWVAGFANLPGDRTEHAVLWVNGQVIDLGSLGGPNSSVGFPAKNSAGMLTGFSQTSDTDPLHEGWNYSCTLAGKLCQGKNLISRGFIWQNGSMKALPTLGGNISQAFGMNNSGQAVGVAETYNEDPTCSKPQVLDYLGVIWNPDGTMQQLAPYPGDHISAAVGINDKGQVVGGSGPCGPLSPSISAHALLWQNGVPIDLGSLGGTVDNGAFAINGQGQVVGFSGLSGNATAHAFLWQNGVMIDLGTLPGDVFSLAFSINDSGQVVGESCDPSFNCRAFLWQSATGMLDLNTMSTPGSAVHLLVANDINDQGQIVGQAYDQNTGKASAFVASPQ
jgi:probable HAF family extracellular repeat protein